MFRIVLERKTDREVADFSIDDSGGTRAVDCFHVQLVVEKTSEKFDGFRDLEGGFAQHPFHFGGGAGQIARFKSERNRSGGERVPVKVENLRGTRAGRPETARRTHVIQEAERFCTGFVREHSGADE